MMEQPKEYTQWLVLAVFFDNDILNRLEALNIAETKTDKEELKENLRKAIGVVATISNRLLYKPKVHELDQTHQSRITKLKNGIHFQNLVENMKSYKFALVELNGIHCIQRNLNNNYVESLIAKCPAPEESDNTVQFCLPTYDELQEPDVKIEHNYSDTIFLSSKNINLRILGIGKFKDEQTGSSGVGFLYGYGSPLISITEYKDMYFIENGYHRAFALLKKGHRFLPCVLRSTDNLSDVVNAEILLCTECGE